MNKYVNNALIILIFSALFALIATSSKRPDKLKATDKLEQQLQEDLFIQALSDSYREEPQPTPKPIENPEEKLDEPNKKSSIPEFKEPVLNEPRRRFLFRRGLPYELSDRNTGCGLRHSSNVINAWDY